jgi:hypothetical protein
LPISFRVRTEDFDEESGSVDVAPVIEISRLILSNDLAIRRGTFIEGKAKFGALIDVICDEGHSVKTLTESDLKIIVGEGYRNFWMRTGTLQAALALIAKNSLNDNICLVFYCHQMTSTIHFGSTMCLGFVLFFFMNGHFLTRRWVHRTTTGFCMLVICFGCSQISLASPR